ncbi:MAG: ZIP family metal transporter [Candidatus Latescibacteria bacterium]|nr:ZIP family metal transporter [Candidatus Latescibacterota bacterium]
MDSHSILILLAYSAGIFVVSFMGGKLAALGTMTHTRTQVVMSLVAGFILGIAMFHLLPHSLDRISGSEIIEKAVGWMVFGMVLMIFLLRIFHFHQHDFSSEASDLYDDHGHDHGVVHSRSLFGVAIGLGVHTVTEGIALGTSMRLGPPHENDVALAGLGVFLAIMLHKPLDAYSIIGMMKSAGHSPRARTLANVGFALLCPVVAIASFGGVELLGSEEGAIVGYVLSFAAGAFLCIALSDLLPEIHFHSHDRGKLIVSLLVGIGLAYVLYYVESSAIHGHGMETHEGH